MSAAASKKNGETIPFLLESKQMSRNSGGRKNKNKYIVLCLIIMILIISIILYFYFAAFSSSDQSTNFDVTINPTIEPTMIPTMQPSNDIDWENEYLLIPSNNSAKEISFSLTRKAHIAGQPENFIVENKMINMLQQWGFQTITQNISNVVLDRYINSSLSIIINSTYKITLDLSNEIIDGDPDTFNNKYRKKAWNSYSFSGNVTYPLIYLNRGDVQDYQILMDNFGFNFTENDNYYIGLIKCCPLSRGQIVYNANLYNLRGVILFTNRDNNGLSINETYTNGQNGTGIRLPPSGFQYGTIKYGTPCVGNLQENRLRDKCKFNGDYDELFPSLKYEIPTITISSENTEKLFNSFLIQNNENGIDGKCDLNMTEYDNWDINIANIDEICIGGNIDVNLITNNDLNKNSTISNLFGYKLGEIYPNEIVMIGAHRDAWSYGACDDISGTTTMLETARSISELFKMGMKLKRTLLLSSWDGEEWGLFGSTYFNENKDEFLNEYFPNSTIISYHNLDMTVQGDNIVIMTTPLIENVVIQSQKKVIYPYQNSSIYTLYDRWMNEDETRKPPTIGQLNSDYAAFTYYSGIPSMETGFWGYTPTYHTFYDLDGWMDLIDPQWKYAQHLAQYVGIITLRLLQTNIIPYDINDLFYRVNQWINNDLINLANNMDCDIFTDQAHFPLLNKSVLMFKESIDVFYENLNLFMEKDDETENVNITSKFNDILKGVNEKLVLKYPDGLPMDYWFKNLLWRPGARFPYIADYIRMGCHQSNITFVFNFTATMFYQIGSLLHESDNIVF